MIGQRCALVFGLWLVASTALAQDIRVYTRIYSGEGNEPIVRSLTLFHAGKVYDYIEPAQEVTVFEPALRKFTVLNKPRQLRSEISQDQIRNFLSLAQDEATKVLGNPTPGTNQKSLELLQFQLQPEFATAFDASKKQLTLSSASFQYVVSVETKAPEVVEKYLHVADWTAQFNAVLHPKSMLPGPRMFLNQELRQRGLIPQSVELTTETEPQLHLVAKHEWTWNLKDADRQMIDSWDSDLQSQSIRQVPFLKFQQEVLKPQIGGPTVAKRTR